MTRKPWLFLMIGLACVCVAGLGIPQLVARQNFLDRGQVSPAPQPRADVGMSPLCVNTALEQYDAEQLAWALETVDQGGFPWMRQRFPWSEIEIAPGDFRWEAWDTIVASAVEQGLQIIAVLDSPPDWAGMPPDPEAFAHFAGAFANHYMGQLVYYEVWHNPNLGDAWGGSADPYAYTALLSLASEAIRTSDPDARIILGGMAPNVEAGPDNYAEHHFLDLLYAAGAAPYFDLVALQPYGFYTAPDDRQVAPDVLNFSRPILVREVLEAHGEGDKAIWASHFGWNSLPSDWEGPPSIWGSVDAQTQAAYTVDALDRAEREWPWMGVLCLNSLQPRPAVLAQAIPDAEEHWGFAIVEPDGTPRPVYEAVQAWSTRSRRAAPGVYPAGTDLAHFEGSWQLGPLGADIGQSGDKVSLEFEGTGVSLTVRRGDYRAFLFVTVDGEPAPALPRDEQGRAYLVLYDPLAEVATVPLAQHLPYGVHTVEVVADRGWGQWALVDWHVSHTPDTRPYTLGIAGFVLLGGLGVLLSVWAGRRIDWAVSVPRLTARFTDLTERAQVILTLVAGVVFGVSAWMSWAQGFFRRLGEGSELVAVLLAAGLFYFSPWFLLALLSGLILFFLVFIHPSMGLALVIASAPFYLHPVSLFGKSFSLSELVLLPTLAGCVLQILTCFLRRRSETDDVPSKAAGKGIVAAFLSKPSMPAVLVFVLVATLSALSAMHSREAFRELRLVVIEPALFYIALLVLPMEKRERWRVVDFFVLGALVVAVVGLVQYFILGDVITAEGGIRRLRSIYGSPNNVGLYLGRVFPLLLAVTLGGGKPAMEGGRWRIPRRRLLYALVLLPVGLALLLTLSRGAIVLGLPAGLIALGLWAGGRWRKVTLIVLLVFAVALIPLFRTPRFAGLLDTSQGTTFLRISLWHSAWRMFLDHPILGVGPDNFLYAYRTRYVLPTAWEEFNLSHPHNWILDFASRLGVLGLAAFLWLQLTFWLRTLSLRRHCEGPAVGALLMGGMAAMVVALAHGLVDASYFYIDLAYSFFLIVAITTWCRDGLC